MRKSLRATSSSSSFFAAFSGPVQLPDQRQRLDRQRWVALLGVDEATSTVRPAGHLGDEPRQLALLGRASEEHAREDGEVVLERGVALGDALVAIAMLVPASPQAAATQRKVPFSSRL